MGQRQKKKQQKKAAIIEGAIKVGDAQATRHVATATQANYDGRTNWNT